jgi:hypothetical protein
MVACDITSRDVHGHDKKCDGDQGCGDCGTEPDSGRASLVVRHDYRLPFGRRFVYQADRQL